MTGSVSQRVPHHVALFTPDFGATTLGDALARLDQPFQQPEFTVRSEAGPEQLHVSVRRLRTSADVVFSVSIEEVVGMRSIRPNAGLRWHHVGYWAESLADDVAALEAAGFRKEVWGPDQAGQPLLFTYMVAANGLRIELVDGGNSPAWKDRVSTARDAAVRTDLEAGVEPAQAEGRPLAHLAAVVENPEKVALSLEQALGVSWDEPRERTARVFDEDGGERNMSYREVQSLGTPQVRLASGPLTDSLGSDERGWDHVAFWSAQLDAEVAELEQHGYVRRASAGGADAATEPFALLSAPEGTRIKLVAAPPHAT